MSKSEGNSTRWIDSIPLWGLILVVVAFAASWGGSQVALSTLSQQVTRIEMKLDNEVQALREENSILDIRMRKLEVAMEVHSALEERDNE